MKCVSPNLDAAQLSLCSFYRRKKKGSPVWSFWSEVKVCNWGPWAGSLHYMSRRVITWGYKQYFFSFEYPALVILILCSFLSPFLFIWNATWIHLLIGWMPYQQWGVGSTFIIQASFNSCHNERNFCFLNRGCNYSLYFIMLLPSEVSSYIVDVCI